MVNPVRNHYPDKNHPFQAGQISNVVKSFLTKNSLETKKLGERLAKKLLKEKSEKTLVIGLIGELGGGKTTFLQGLAKGLGVKEKITSPTFVIMKKFLISNSFALPAGRQFLGFYHIDCYRIQKPKEFLDLGFKKIIFNPQNIVAIEWADRIKKILPKNALWIKFKFIDKEKRQITIKQN